MFMLATAKLCQPSDSFLRFFQVQSARGQDHSDQRPHRRHQSPRGEGGHHHLRVDGQYIFTTVNPEADSDGFRCYIRSYILEFYFPPNSVDTCMQML